jgi:antitoxin MazE
MKTHIQKWGNSVALRIPKSFADDLGVGESSPVEMSLEEGAILIRPDREGVWDLDALVAEVTDENIHPSWETAGAWSDRDDVDEGEP